MNVNTNEKTEKKTTKILVRLPNWLGDVVMSFPFLENLHTEFPWADILVIVKPEFLGLMGFLSFKVRTYPFDKKKYPFPFGIHKYANDMVEIFNIDLYFCLPPSFSAAFMGICFRD